MSSKTISRLAWAFCTLVIIFGVILIGVNFYWHVGSAGLFQSIITFVTLTTFAIVGALILSHQPGNTIGWLLMIEAALVFVWPLDIYFNNLFQPTEQPTLIIFLGLWIYLWMWIWYIFPILYIPLFFPTGKLLSPRWRWVAALGLGLCLFLIFFATFTPEFMAQDGTWSVPNPIGFINIEFPMAAWAIALLSFAGLCVGSLFLRYRRGSWIERSQIKWLLYTVVLFFVIYSITFLFNSNSGGTPDLIFGALLGLAIILFPVAIGVAILRHRLYDIDIIIRKTLVYAVLTGTLTLVYFGMVILLQSVVDLGAKEQSPLIIVVSTLVIAALFSPLRRRIQAVIDRRFFRQKYDAQEVLAHFAQVARDETETNVLTAELLDVVQETIHPDKVGLWLLNSQSTK